MKKNLIFIGIVIMFSFSSLAQNFDIGQKIKDKGEQHLNDKIDQSIDSGFDKIEEGITNAINGKKNKNKNKNNDTDIPSQQKNTNIYTASNSKNEISAYDPAKTKTDDKGNTDYSAYKNFNFIAGDQIIFFEDFKDGSKKRWGAYDIDNEVDIVNINGANWLEVKSGQFFPLGLKTLPKNFTLEFDVHTPDKNTGSLGVRFVDQSQAEALGDPWLDNTSEVTFSPITHKPKTGLGNYQKKINNEELSPQNEFIFYTWQPELGQFYARISLSCNKNKVSVWVNKEQVMDNIDLLADNLQYYLSFHLQNYFVAENRMYLTNFKLATGNVNAKSELDTKKKFITQNIYFDVNSDVIRPNSYAVLKEIAESIKSIQGNILIVGHTDSDGSDAANLTLSKKRAESVKRALINEFGIDANRLSTDGKGESIPLNKNLTPSDKAKNRRVEFIVQ